MQKIKSSLTENISQLIGIPLQTKMMADIFLNKLNLANIEFNSIADLYHEFVEMKFNIQFEGKNKFEIARDEDFYEKEKKKFYEDHIQLSLMILFKENESELLFNGIDQKRILKFGFIVSFGNENLTPTFLHQSYAEYFVAKRAINKLEQQNNANMDGDDELDKILQNEEFFLVRKFLNDLLSFKAYEQLQQNIKVPKSKARSKDLLFFRMLCCYCSNNKINEHLFGVEIENCCRENLVNILIYLIKIKNVDAIHLNRNNIKFLLVASANGHKNIVELLLQNGIDINQRSTKNLELNFINEELRNVGMLNFLMLFGRVSGEPGENALHVASKYGHKDIVELLVQEGIDINQSRAFSQTSLGGTALR